MTGDRIAAVCAELVTVYPERAAGSTHSFAAPGSSDTPLAPVTTEDAALVMFRTVAGAHGSVVISQISSGHKNQLRFELAGPGVTLAFDQEHPDELWVGGRTVSQTVARDPAVLDPAAAAYVLVPPGHPQGYQDCFDLFVADTYRAIAAGSADKIDGLPTFADGRRANAVVDAVVRSSATRAWVDLEEPA